MNRGTGTQLALATFAFTICFYGWSLLAARARHPGGARPVGLPDVRDGRRPRAARFAHADPARLAHRMVRRPAGVHRVDVVHAAAARRACKLFHDSLAPILVFGFLLGFAGASFAVGVPFVNGWYGPEKQGPRSASTGWAWAARCSPVSPRLRSRTNGGLPPRSVAAALVALAGAVFYALARDARPARERGQGPGMFAALAVFRGNRRAWAPTPTSWPSAASSRCSCTCRSSSRQSIDLTKADAGARAAGSPCSRSSAGRSATSDRVGAARILLGAFSAVGVLALVLAVAYTEMVPLTIARLTMAVALGLGTGAVFKLVPEWFPDRVGSVTGVVGAAGGYLGGFPPLVMGIVKGATGGYALGVRPDGAGGARAGPCWRACGCPDRALPDGQTAPTRG